MKQQERNRDENMRILKKGYRVLFIVFALFVIVYMSDINDDNIIVAQEDKNLKSILSLKHELRFDKRGKFKIVIFADIQDTLPVQESTLDYMNKILDKVKPGLVILGGDNFDGSQKTANRLREYLTIISEPMELRKIPWCHVYGNHAEGGYEYFNGLKKERQQPIYESFDYCISKTGDADVYGVGNYVLPVLRSDSDKIGFNVFCLDSHSYLNNFEEGLEEKVLLKRFLYSGKTYDVIHFSQINWYWNTSVALENYNGSKIPAMMFFHIPLYEWNYIVRNPNQTDIKGTQNEEVCAPEANSGLLWAVYERGDVKAMFCGHDHTNDFSGKYMGITMGYTPTIGAKEYYKAETRGARVVEVDQNDAFNFTTKIIYCNKLN